jgi:hypothetical protein
VLGPALGPAADRRPPVRLFRRRKSGGDGDGKAVEPDTGMLWLVRDLTAKAENEFLEFVLAHLRRIHEPGGVEREKKEVSDYMDLGMGREYLEALDDIEFTPVETIVAAVVRGPKGKCDVVTRWTVRGIHARPLAGAEPTGQETTIVGVTITSIRDYRIRSDVSYWQIPELTRTFLGS